jgi:hypothetical protein
MRKFLALPFALALFVPLAACGGGDDEESSSSSGSSSASASSEDEETTTTTEEDDGGDGEASDEFCGMAETFAEEENLDELDFEDPDDVEIAVGLLEEFRDAAPDDVAEDIDLLVEAFGAIVEVLNDNPDDPEAQAEAFAELEEEFADVEQATERVEEFTREACGVDISGDSGTDTTEASGSGVEGEDTSLEDFADDVEACEGGDMAACDELFLETPVDSEAEQVAEECGGEDPEGGHFGDCEQVFG